MKQTELGDYTLPEKFDVADQSKDPDKLSEDKSFRGDIPRGVIVCTKCKSVMKNNGPTSDGTGKYLFSCTNNFCGTGTTGLGKAAVQIMETPSGETFAVVLDNEDDRTRHAVIKSVETVEKEINRGTPYYYGTVGGRSGKPNWVEKERKELEEDN